MTGAVPPGWYPDPAGSGGQRWWDGAQWTDGVAPPSQAAPPAGPAPVADRSPGADRTRRGWVVGVGAAALVALVGFAWLATAGDDAVEPNEAAESADPEGPAADQPSESDAESAPSLPGIDDAPVGTGDAPGGPRIDVGEFGGLATSCLVHDDGGVSCWGAGRFSSEVGEDGVPAPDEWGRYPSPVRLAEVTGALGVRLDLPAPCIQYPDGVDCHLFLEHGAAPELVAALDAGLAGAADVGVDLRDERVCRLEREGGVSCWSGGEPTAWTPLEGLDGPAVAMSVGEGIGCVVLVDGGVACWGSSAAAAIGLAAAASDEAAVQPAVSAVVQPVVEAAPDTRDPRAVRVPGITDARAVATAAGEACVLHTGGGVSCWGGGYLDGDLEGPVRVDGVEAAADVDGGAGAFCAVVDDGRVRCWGRSGDDAVGGSPAGSRAELVEVPGVAGATEVAVGPGHACARLDGDRFTCWGDDDMGQLGDGTSDDRDAGIGTDDEEPDRLR